VSGDGAAVREINAVTLVTTDMAGAVAFYADLGFALNYGGPDSAFTSLYAGAGFLNLQLVDDWQQPAATWTRCMPGRSPRAIDLPPSRPMRRGASGTSTSRTPRATSSASRSR
jgi:catechol 2,3-dioxygenase-like lactoylglutathione lyase family enzyme